MALSVAANTVPRICIYKVWNNAELMCAYEQNGDELNLARRKGGR